MKKKIGVLISALVVLIIAVVAIFLNHSDRDTMNWANELSVVDITKIELVVMPSVENERYKLFAENEYEEIVKLLNNCKGRYVSSPESISGGGSTLYITLADGTTHSITNNGNVYLVIDGDNYSVSDSWLSAWDECGLDRGNAKIPDNFVY